MSNMFGGSPKTPKVPVIEPNPAPVEVTAPVQQVSAQGEEEAIHKQLAKRKRATLLAQGVENPPQIFKQKLGTG